ncbi:putative plastid-lipid-associated protein 2, chloroplastic [Iris pallida]|uniref:Plastid-lipid-associated protein 2, chloroplastic n=1 Tax=Iris pallida TaxID=29817 RepID=A0AAX6GV28_IRIPA|nr:putative plastid-lipid-associated protein 2, chloroplastic [Iris pallida]
MAVSASFSLFSIKNLPKVATVRCTSSQLPLSTSVTSPWLTEKGAPPQPSFVARAIASDNKLGKGKGGGGGDDTVAAAEKKKDAGPAAAADQATLPVGELKGKLEDSLKETGRGLNTAGEKRTEILELLTQIEANNPTPAPTKAHDLLDGKWILLYTSHAELFPRLGPVGLQEVVKVGEISQTIDSKALTLQNSVTYHGLVTTTVSTKSKLIVLSPDLIQINVVESIIGAPEFPESIVSDKAEIFGHQIDLSPLKGMIASVTGTISSQPPVNIPIYEHMPMSKSWLLTTYLDENLRISKGEEGCVFVFLKEGFSLLD